jgi:DNA-binding transcriptional regulator YhcF (GntR family)
MQELIEKMTAEGLTKKQMLELILRIIDEIRAEEGY